MLRLRLLALAALLPALLLPPPAAAQRLDPIVYTLKFPAVDLMIPVWSPGYYVKEVALALRFPKV